MIRLQTRIEAAARAYFLTYMTTFIASAALLVALVWWRQGTSVASAAALAGGIAAGAWSYWSGRAYVERMFQRERVSLADCLRQLDGAQ